MACLLTALFCVVTAVSFLPAAPVPTHLFPKDRPLYYPTQKGASWVYLENNEEHRYVVTDVEMSSSGDARLVTVCEVIGEKQKPYRKMAVSRRGLVWVETTGSMFDKPLWMLRCPVRADDEWPIQSSGPNIFEGAGAVRVSGTQTIEVPAGTFSAVRIDLDLLGKHSDVRIQQSHWYAPRCRTREADLRGIGGRIEIFHARNGLSRKVWGTGKNRSSGPSPSASHLSHSCSSSVAEQLGSGFCGTSRPSISVTAC